MTAQVSKDSRPLGWRSAILKHFTREASETTRLSIATDPDHLLTEQAILVEQRSQRNAPQSSAVLPQEIPPIESDLVVRHLIPCFFAKTPNRGRVVFYYRRGVFATDKPIAAMSPKISKTLKACLFGRILRLFPVGWVA